MSVDRIEQNSHPIVSKARKLAIGATLLAGSIGVGYSFIESNILNHDLAVVTDRAQPSDLLAKSFTYLETAGEAFGAVFLAKRGLHHLRLPFNESDQAIYSLNNASRNPDKKTKVKSLAAASILMGGAGLMIGNYSDIAKGVSHTQSNVAQLFDKTLSAKPSKGSQNLVVSNSPTPDILNTNFINVSIGNQILNSANNQGIPAVPIYKEWVSGSRVKNGQPIEFLAIGMPQSATGLKESSNNCQTVNVDAAKELGVPVGKTFDVQGLELKVNHILTGSSGFNLLPIIMNSQDYTNCLNSNDKMPYSMILMDSTKQKIESILNKVQANSNTDPNSKRLYVATTQEFSNNALQTGQNAVDGLVLEAMMLGLGFAGIAISYKARTNLANNRKVNLFLKANGFTEKMVSKIYTEKMESEIIESSLFAFPAVLLFDAMTNLGEPGAALGPSLKTYLTILGLTWGVGRLSTSIALRREATNYNFDKGQVL